MLQGRVRKIDKRTTLPLRIPKNGGGCTKRRPVLDVHDVKQQGSHRSRACPRRQFSMRRLGKPDPNAPFTREIAPRTCTEIRFDRRARSRTCGRASARSGHVGQVARESVTGPSGPSCLFGGGFLARRRLVCRCRPLSGRSGREQHARLFGTHDSAVARSCVRPSGGGAEREAM